MSDDDDGIFCVCRRIFHFEATITTVILNIVFYLVLAEIPGVARD
jgi:hypothetical protein